MQYLSPITVKRFAEMVRVGEEEDAKPERRHVIC